MNCPQCSDGLRTIVYEGVEVSACDGCGGEFVGHDGLAQIVRTRDARFAPELTATISERPPIYGVPTEERERRLCCPVCNKQMDVVNYGGDSGVFVDRCGACGGVWLDRQELEQVQAIMERWQDDAPEQLRAVATELEASRRDTALRTANPFAGSRFAFVNAMINRVLDAA